MNKSTICTNFYSCKVTVIDLILLTFEQFKEYSIATSVKQLQMSKDNKLCSINSANHSQMYTNAFVANVFDKFMDPSPNA